MTVLAGSADMDVASLVRDGWSIIAGDTWALAAFGVLVAASLVAVMAFAIGESRRRNTARRQVNAATARVGAMAAPRPVAVKKKKISTRGQTPRAAQVIKLARSGANPDAIARSTGLAHDAVRTILRTPADMPPVTSAAPVAKVRQPSPSAAQNSAPGRYR